MARYILIDHNSGYIWGDSADLDGKIFNGTPVEFAIAVDTDFGAYDGTYTFTETNSNDAQKTYDVYRVDVDGSEVMPVVRDGQDGDTIRTVVEHGRYITALVREPANEEQVG